MLGTAFLRKMVGNIFRQQHEQFNWKTMLSTSFWFSVFFKKISILLLGVDDIGNGFGTGVQIDLLIVTLFSKQQKKFCKK